MKKYIVILVVLLVAAGCNSQKTTTTDQAKSPAVQEQTNIQQPGLSKDSFSANWADYNTSYGFSFKYPKDKVSPMVQEDQLGIFYGPDLIGVFIVVKTTLADYIQQLMTSDETGKFHSTNIAFNNKKAIKIYADQDWLLTAVEFKDGSVLAISAPRQQTSPGINSTQEQKNLYNQIVSTIVFK